MMPTSTNTDTLLIFQAAATWFMTGVIWTIQLVHYPLFDHGGPAYPVWQTRHMNRISIVVIPPMLVELGTAAYAVWAPGTLLPRSWAALGLAAVAGVWGSTFVWQEPAHSTLARGYDAAVHSRLVNSNWVRTVLWSARAVLLAAALGGALA